jgi:hypothetical protein
VEGRTGEEMKSKEVGGTQRKKEGKERGGKVRGEILE